MMESMRVMSEKLSRAFTRILRSCLMSWSTMLLPEDKEVESKRKDRKHKFKLSLFSLQAYDRGDTVTAAEVGVISH